jgi:hypothetical protein
LIPGLENRKFNRFFSARSFYRSKIVTIWFGPKHFEADAERLFNTEIYLSTMSKKIGSRPKTFRSAKKLRGVWDMSLMWT